MTNKKKIAFVFDLPKGAARNRHKQIVERYLHPSINFDIHYLADNDDLERVLVKDMTIDIEALKKEYLFIVPVGAEPFKKLVKHKGGITKYSGQVVEDPFLCVPIMSPLIVYINPSMHPKIEDQFSAIYNLYEANGVVVKNVEKTYKILTDVTDYFSTTDGVVAYDLETTALDPYDGDIIGASFCKKEGEAVFVTKDVLESNTNKLRKFLRSNKIIMHNAKFDMKWTMHKFNIDIPDFEDTMIVHYLFIDQTKGTHSLKLLAMQYSDLGDYSREQDEYIKKFCRQHKVLLKDFTFDMIPTELLYPYACDDANATMQVYNNMVLPALEKADPLTVKCYREIMLPASRALLDMELIGAPIDKCALDSLATDLEGQIEEADKELHAFKEVRDFERAYGPINLNSPAQLGKLLFQYFGFKSVKKTTTGNDSTDVEVLTKLGEKHKFPTMIIKLRKLKKLYDTYVLNIRELIKTNGRLRGNFNLTVAESGRLSSSQENND